MKSANSKMADRPWRSSRRREEEAQRDTRARASSSADFSGVKKDRVLQESPLPFLFNMKRVGPCPHDELPLSQQTIHPAVVRTGLQMRNRVIVGSNARTTAMLTAFKRVVMDYHPTPYVPLEQRLKSQLDIHINFLIKCRPHNPAMGNAIRWLKGQIQSMGRLVPFTELKYALVQSIDQYIRERIVYASLSIACHVGGQFTRSGDKIMVYGNSSAVRLALQQAAAAGCQFSVVIVDEGPFRDGLKLAKQLDTKVDVEYTFLNGIAYHIKSCTKILLGSAAVFLDGSVLGRAGSGSLAVMGKCYAKPVIVVAETYKIANKLVVGSCASNELGDSRALEWNTSPCPNALKWPPCIHGLHDVKESLLERLQTDGDEDTDYEFSLSASKRPSTLQQRVPSSASSKPFLSVPSSEKKAKPTTKETASGAGQAASRSKPTESKQKHQSVVLVYDVIPASLIDMVITEHGYFPTEVVAVMAAQECTMPI